MSKRPNKQSDDRVYRRRYYQAPTSRFFWTDEERLDVARRAKKLIAEQGLTMTQVAARFGHGRERIRECIKFLDLQPEDQDATRVS